MKVSKHPLYDDTGTRDLTAIVDNAMVAKLEASFGLLASSKINLAERFYERLFETAPALRSMFPADMKSQQQKLLAALGMVVAHLRQPAVARKRLEELGRSHVAYGVLPEHYPIVTETLVASMGEVAGLLWSRELHEEWLSAVTMVANIMMQGAAQAANGSAGHLGR